MSERRCRKGVGHHPRATGPATPAAVLGTALILAMAPLAVPTPAQADPLDAVVDSIANSIDGLGGLGGLSAGGADALADPGAVSAALADAAGNTAVPSLAAAITDIDQTLVTAFHQYVYLPIHTAEADWIASPFGQAVDRAINAPFLALTGHDLIGDGGGGAAGGWLFGDGGAGSDGSDGAAPAAAVGTDSSAGAAAAPLAATATSTNVTVPMQITAVTEPLVQISVSGGAPINVVVDTGSNGLVMPWWNIGLDHLSLPTNFGFGAYSGGLNYFYLTFPETVTFMDGHGNDLVTTETTDVNAFIFGFPTSLSGLVDFPWTLGQFLGPAQAEGVLGIAPDAAGPDTSGQAAVLSALPGPLNQGVLFDEPNKQLIFGPSQLSGGTTVQGVADSSLAASINGGPPGHVSAIIDSGGVFGTMPSSVPGATAIANSQGILPQGTEISVLTQDGTPLYNYTVGTTLVGSNSPVVISSDSMMNTGYIPFSQMPVYIGFGSSGPTTTFYTPPATP